MEAVDALAVAAGERKMEVRGRPVALRKPEVGFLSRLAERNGVVLRHLELQREPERLESCLVEGATRRQILDAEGDVVDERCPELAHAARSFSGHDGSS